LGGVFKVCLVCWVVGVVGVFRKFCVLSYGSTPLSASDVLKLRWKESWDFIVHK
jgi:dolichyl-phosphate-mannose-protein mannosyltransferase